MRTQAFGRVVPSPIPFRSVLKQTLLHAIHFKPSVLQARIGRNACRIGKNSSGSNFTALSDARGLCSYMEKSHCDSGL